MTENPANAPDPDSTEFLRNQDTVEKVSPGNDADEVALDANLIPTDPPSAKDS